MKPPPLHAWLRAQLWYASLALAAHPELLRDADWSTVQGVATLHCCDLAQVGGGVA